MTPETTDRPAAANAGDPTKAEQIAAHVGRQFYASLVIPDPDPSRPPLQLAAALVAGRACVYVVGFNPTPLQNVHDATEAAHERRPDITRARARQYLGSLVGIVRQAQRDLR